MDVAAAQNLRALVHDCLAKHMYEAAIFFADKLVTLSAYAPAEVYTLAQAFFVDRQFRRCLQLLRTADVIEADLRFRYLAARCAAAERRPLEAPRCARCTPPSVAAQRRTAFHTHCLPPRSCLAECKEWEECLELLGGLDLEGPEGLPFAPTAPRAPGAALDDLSAVCLLRGRVYDALENLPRAARWYAAALERDPLNVEAFQALVGGHKLSNAEELEVRACPGGGVWLQ
jgi:anaphase-promoting complex subunit 6